jgi:hypothetical protein
VKHSPSARLAMKLSDAAAVVIVMKWAVSHFKNPDKL